MISDETITRLVLGTGWRPGDAINDDAVRAWMAAVAGECVRAVEGVRDRYTKTTSMFTGGDDAARASRIAAENCIRAVQAALAGPG